MFSSQPTIPALGGPHVPASGGSASGGSASSASRLASRLASRPPASTPASTPLSMVPPSTGITLNVSLTAPGVTAVKPRKLMLGSRSVGLPLGGSIATLKAGGTLTFARYANTCAPLTSYVLPSAAVISDSVAIPTVKRPGGSDRVSTGYANDA